MGHEPDDEPEQARLAIEKADDEIKPVEKKAGQGAIRIHSANYYHQGKIKYVINF
jgi:hypothetical protein